MSKDQLKSTVISFKADSHLEEALSRIPNRSEFIRNTLESALAGVCPLCQGSGYLNNHQQEHWRHFSQDHDLENCQQCHAPHLVCRENR